MRVSIVICNYNYARFLDGAIRSAVEQDYADKEIIVVDDGSTDDSRDIVERWGGSVQPIYKENGGQVSAYNAGFEKVTGEVVIFLDSDDLLERGACTRIMGAYAAGIVKAHFRLRLVDAEGVHLGSTIPRALAEGNVGARLLSRGELYESAPGSGNAYRVSTLRSLMPIPVEPGDRHGADFFCIYGIGLLGAVGVAGPEPLGCYRVHSAAPLSLAFGNASRDMKEPFRTSARYTRLQAWLLDRLGPRYTLPPRAPDFALEKQTYAVTIFSAKSYLAGLRVGAPLLISKVLPSIGRMKSPAHIRAGLAGWALAVLLLPRKVGRPVAVYVCNPASR